MATKNIMAKNAKNTKSANKSAKPKATKAVAETVEVNENVEVTPTDETVLNAKSDITQVDGEATCSDCGISKPQTTENFSMLQSGKFRNICKPCQTIKSGEWTEAKKDYRKAYARANFFQNRGIPALVPNAKDWKAGDPIMTVEYVDPKTGETVPSRNAEDVYQEQVAAIKAEREARKAEQDAIVEAARAERKLQRETAKAEREATKAAEAEAKKAEREATKAQRAIERAEKAEAAKAEREAARAVKAQERAAAALAKAEEAKAAREQKAVERAAAQAAKSLEKAEQARLAREAKIDAANAKAIAALKGENTQAASAAA